MTNLAISLFTERMLNLVGAEVVLKLLRETEDIEEMGGLNIQVKCAGIPCRLQFQHWAFFINISDIVVEE